MRIVRENGLLTLQAERYRLSFPADRPFVYVDDSSGARLAELFVLSSVHPLHGRDDTVAFGDWQVTDAGDQVICTLQARSSVWAGKTYRLRCTPQRFVYEISVAGHGRLAEVCYFGGYSSARVRWGSGFFYSGQRFERGFTPEPNSAEATYFSPNSTATIDLLGVPVPGRGDWFFTPPPFCFAFALPPSPSSPAGRETGEEGRAAPHPAGERWIAFGVEATAGSHGYTRYTYHGRQDAFHLALDFEGYTGVNGEYILPAISFDFAKSEWAALAAHIAAGRNLHMPGALQGARHEDDNAPGGRMPSAPTVAHVVGADGVRPAAVRPGNAWWREPIFCGWGAQCYIAREQGGRAPDYARQAVYEGLLATLSAHGITPGTIVIDDKWQATYGENAVDEAKWPDLPGFIQEQHRQGRRVLLWLKAWDPEGAPPDECIRNAAGLPVAVDPTNPAFEHRFRAAIRRMLSAEGYDADGFKLDFSARIPSGPGMVKCGDSWGLELMRRYLGILYDEAKQVKPDALIITHTPHPYLADIVDMIRLNDINTGSDVLAAMQRRARVARLACPAALIDTDNWPMPDRATWRAYLQLQPQLGVPALYYVTHIDATGEALTEEDYALIRNVWATYRSSLSAEKLNA